jgi:hypothetical protein
LFVHGATVQSVPTPFAAPASSLHVGPVPDELLDEEDEEDEEDDGELPEDVDEPVDEPLEPEPLPELLPEPDPPPKAPLSPSTTQIWLAHVSPALQVPLP